MINPDLHLTLYISEEVIRLVCGTFVCVTAIWAVVKMTQILFGKSKKAEVQAVD